LLLLAFTAGCFTNLENGHTVAGPVVGRAIQLAGYGPTAGGTLRVEVLDPANQDPNDSGATWTFLTNTTASAAATYHPDGTPLYSFNVSAVPNPSGSAAWRDGGLAWLRVRDEASGVTIVPYDDLACAQAHPGPLLDTIADCGSPDDGGRGKLGWSSLALVDTDPRVPTASGVIYLDKVRSSTTEATAYQSATGAAPTDARFTLPGWLGVNHFDGTEVGATYYNAQDLGSGRSMHCREVLANDPGEVCDGTGVSDVVRTACYVTNYGDIGLLAASASAVQEAVDDAPNHALNPPDPQSLRSTFVDPVTGLSVTTVIGGAVATVAMEHVRVADDDTAYCLSGTAAPIVDPVRFYAYEHASVPATYTQRVQLTALQAPQVLPGVCLNCHGGDSPEPGVVTDAHFLPFDLTYFDYSTDSAFTRTAQEASFRELNRLVLETEPSLGTQISQVLLDHYGVAAPPLSGTFDDAPPPPGTVDLDGDGSPDDIDADGIGDVGWTGEERLYDEVYRPYCRGCHAAQQGTLNFDTYGEFESTSGLIGFDVCQVQTMPHARVTMEQFRNSRARAVLVGELRDFGFAGPLDCPDVP
jgi:hypothetical protein